MCIPIFRCSQLIQIPQLAVLVGTSRDTKILHLEVRPFFFWDRKLVNQEQETRDM